MHCHPGCSQRLPAVHEGHQAQLPQGYFGGQEVASQAERGHQAGDSKLPGTLCEEPLRGCHEGPCPLKVPAHLGVALQQAPRAGVLLRDTVYPAQAVHEGHHL